MNTRVPHIPPPVLRPATIAARAGLAAIVILAATPGAAFAHGVTGAGGVWYSFIWSGFIHMLAGWDHLLFVAGIMLLSGGIKRSTQMISLFAVGHSTTLIVASMAGWRINATAVDVVIALSLVFIGVVGWIGRPTTWRWFGASVFGFGLIHGMGLSTRLQDIGLPHDTLPLLARVISFNIGVELGQLAAVALMFMLGDVLRRYLTWPHTWKATHATMTGIGVIAAILLATGVIGVTAPTPADAATQKPGLGSCQLRACTETYPDAASGAHPKKDFYEPAETTPLRDFGHVMGDNMVLVHYRPDLTENQLSVLRAFITSEDGTGVLAGPAPGQNEVFKAVNRFDTMVCTEFDLKPLITFKNNWFKDSRSRGM